MNSLENQEILHQIEVERVENGIVKKCLQRVDSANKLIAEELKKTKGVYTKERYKEIRKFLKDESKILKSDINKDMSVEDFIEYELLAQEKLYKKYLKGSGVNFKFPTVEQMVTSATFGSYTDSSNFENYLDSLELNFFNVWDSNVREGYMTGIPTQRIVRNVVGKQAQNAQLAEAGAMKQFKNSVMANTRTALQAMANDTRRIVMEKNADLIDFYEWVGVLDRKTCVVCGSLDSTVHKQIKDFGNQPPIHFNCLLGDTFVSTSSPISRIYRRAYKGNIYVIHTASGNVLSVTPNHPILTDKGFVGAKFLNVGDNVICNNGFKLIDIVDKDKNKTETTIENLFSTFAKSSKVVTSSMPLTTKDFHSDLSDNEVDIISIDGELSDKVDVITFKELGKSIFINGFAKNSIDLSSKCVLVKFFVRHFPAFTNFVSLLCKTFNLFWSRIFHSFNLLFSFVSHRNVVSTEKTNHLSSSESKSCSNSCNADTFIVKSKNRFKRWVNLSILPFFTHNNIGTFKNISDDVFGNTVLSRNILYRNSALIKFDRIIGIEIVQKSTHIYNLETVDNFYFSNNIVSHNCRCLIVPRIKGFEELEEDGTRASENGQVDSKITFNDWLKEQPKDVQKEVLGATRYEMFKNGAEINEFVNDGKIIPLDKMLLKERNITVRNMANGMRRSIFNDLSEEEINFVKKESNALHIKESEIIFIKGASTHYDEKLDLVIIGSDVMPSNDDSNVARDLISVRGVLAHEYYGHKHFKGTRLLPQDPRDEFRASYYASVNAPNLSDLDRQLLMRDALDRANEAGIKIRITDVIRGILYGYKN